jgi:hypothetical protein
MFGFQGDTEDTVIDRYKQIRNMLLLQTPSLLMIWIKTILCLRAWCSEDFNRKSVERYYMYTFVYEGVKFEKLYNLPFICDDNKHYDVLSPEPILRFMDHSKYHRYNLHWWNIYLYITQIYFIQR